MPLNIEDKEHWPELGLSSQEVITQEASASGRSQFLPAHQEGPIQDRTYPTSFLLSFSHALHLAELSDMERLKDPIEEGHES